MIDELTLKKFKVRDLDSGVLEQIERIDIISKDILDPERTLYELAQDLKKQHAKTREEEDALKEAVRAITAQGEVLQARHAPRQTEKRRPFQRQRGVNLMDKTNGTHMKIVAQTPLSRAESIAVLQQGNTDFQTEVTKLDRGRINESKQEYDVLMLTCADARCDATLFRDFTNQRVLVLQVAGNVYGSKDKRARAKIDAALRKLKQGGTVVLMGHAKCGAVDAHAHADHYVGKVSRHVDMLVDCVDRQGHPHTHDDYEANAANQAQKLSEHATVKEKKLSVVPCIFDFTNGEDKALRYLGNGKEPPLLTELRHSAVSRLTYAREHHYTLPAQYAHAIVVSDPTDLGQFTNPRIAFNARLNELFAVSAMDGELSSDAIASIEYALLKVNGVKDAPHIVITHTDPKTAQKLKDQLLKESDIVREKTQNGELITIMEYNKETHGVRAA